MLIDFHIHIFPDELAERAIKTLEQRSQIPSETDGTAKDTLNKMDIWGVDKAVCLNIATKPTQQRKINQFMEKVSSSRLIPFGTIHPDSPDAKEELFYKVLSEECGEIIGTDVALMRYVCDLAKVKKGYDKIKDAFAEAEKNGYGVVEPCNEDYVLKKPQLVKKSAGYGVQFKANAASYHIVKVDVTGEICPIIGTKEQSENFIDETVTGFENGMDGVWETNIFGRSLRALVGDELSGKTNAMPIELRKKMRRTVTKIVNDGNNNAICLLF
jgi:stage IV sporulation protein A